MNNQHPITPPPELVEQWRMDYMNRGRAFLGITKEIAQWGADQELEACVEWIAKRSPLVSREMQAARRPKPPTMNSIALQMLGTIERDAHYLPEITDTIRRALEALPND
jgi:hypothetical protein